MPARHRDALDRVGHAGHRDLHAPFGHACSGVHARVGAYLGASCAKRFAHHTARRAARRPGPNTGGNQAGWMLAQHDVRVGHRQRPAAAVAGRAGSAPAAFRVPRAAARRRSGTEPPPAATVWMLIIGARMRTPATCGRRRARTRRRRPATNGSTSVEVPPMSKPMTVVPPACARRARHADDAAGRAGEDRVPPWKWVGLGQPAELCMRKYSRYPRHRGRHLVDIAAQDGRDRRRPRSSPRGTSFISGLTSCDTRDLAKPRIAPGAPPPPRAPCSASRAGRRWRRRAAGVKGCLQVRAAGVSPAASAPRHRDTRSSASTTRA